MIGMMYLVLTAMLALNVSSEILNGFSMLDTSLHKNIESLNSRNSGLYSDFNALNEKNPTKVGDWLKKAKLVKENSDNLYKYIENFKVTIIRMADGKKANDSAYVFQIQGKDNLDKASQYGLKENHGEELKKKIDEYRLFLAKISDNNPSKLRLYETIFSTSKTKSGKSWIDAMFEGMPLSAVVTILTKYQNDIRTSEADIVEYLKAQTDASDFRVNKMTALVIPDSRYVIRGDKFKAQIVLSAVDSTKAPNYYVNGAMVPKGMYETSCLTSGSKSISGQVTFMGNDGVLNSKPFKCDYTVGDPAATISNEDLNVVYRGIDNKFSVSVPGVSADKVSIRVAGGTFTKANGRFIIRPTQDGEINISVYALIDKKELLMGGGAYRVKYIPDPKSFLQYTDNGGVVRQIQDGDLTKRLLKSNGVSLIASYGPDELIKANFEVKSFAMVTIMGNVASSGSRLNSRMLADIDKLEGGDYVTFKNIKAVGPDGKTRSLGLIQVKL
jgi:gliding motility-associated protein GldM